MKVDLYTKIVLTAIAIGLFLNVAKELSPLTALAELSNYDTLRIQITHSGYIGGR